MICWDWMGMVTVRRLTFRITSTNGIMNRMPGLRTLRTRPTRNTTPRSYSSTMAAPNLGIGQTPPSGGWVVGGGFAPVGGE
jgi:hypothetical protein